MSLLQQKVSSQGGVYKRYSNFLQKLGIDTFEDFLYHIPFRYEDYSIVSKISEVQAGETVTIKGKVDEIKNQYTRRFMTLQKAKVSDDTGSLEVIWFNQPYIAKNITPGDSISLSGKIDKDFNRVSMKAPDFEIGEENIHTGRIVPVYKETRGISSKWIRKQVYKLLNDDLKDVSDFLPVEVSQRNSLEDLTQALWSVHFPSDLDQAIKSRKRLEFNELFLMQSLSLSRRKEWKKEVKGNKFAIDKNKTEIDKLLKSLPFKLTEAQERTLKEIFSDMSKDTPMNRLLEGDVGSGKTIVAAVAMYLAKLNGYKSILMAPTEILANQHFSTISNFLSPFGVKVGLATGSKKSGLEDFDILVGTHAIIFVKQKIDNLGLLVIDEQQRFGVEQRSLVRKKAKNPHVLTMTATPIPRTIALTIYGDLDLSILDEMPKGRKTIKTWLVPAAKRTGAYDWIKEQIKQNKSQAFIICPFIEESESMTTVKAATKEYETLSKDVFKDFKLGLLHGKLKSKEKDQILNDFKEGAYDILVATPVVEVGIDIPNADIIIIEAAERFGLSQLHQLRGRVGRGDRQSYCLLFTESPNPTTIERLKAMEKSNIGAELAELDLKLRGPGEIYGTKQHGSSLLKIADFSDYDLIKKTKDEAEAIIDRIDEFPELLKKVEEINTSEVSPD